MEQILRDVHTRTPASYAVKSEAACLDILKGVTKMKEQKWK